MTPLATPPKIDPLDSSPRWDWRTIVTTAFIPSYVDVDIVEVGRAFAPEAILPESLNITAEHFEILFSLLSGSRVSVLFGSTRARPLEKTAIFDAEKNTGASALGFTPTSCLREVRQLDPEIIEVHSWKNARLFDRCFITNAIFAIVHATPLKTRVLASN
jgi:hypothetical protein